jgi:predicted nucleic acid-binding protein
MPRDRNHEPALRQFRNLSPRTRLLTTDYVVAETVTWLLYRDEREAAFRLKRMIEASQQQSILTLAWITPEIHDAAWDIVRRYDDQRFSFYDCTSFAICAARDVDFVFGFDSDFRIAGFDLRPGPEP